MQLQNDIEILQLPPQLLSSAPRMPVGFFGAHAHYRRQYSQLIPYPGQLKAKVFCFQPTYLPVSLLFCSGIM
ncbi:hypothetical protein D1872_350210 [compost metagenome]